MSRPSASASHTPTTSNISGARRTRRKNLRDGSREAAVSVSVTSSVRSKSTAPPDSLKDNGSSKEHSLSPAHDKPWRHPDELEYICRQDWSKDLMITYLCQKSFSIPRRDPNTTNGTVHITQRDGSVVVLPRGYRVPLMFLAVFQWDSLRLVLLSTDPDSEWEEYKFDIIHLCRLCQHLFRQAAGAASIGGSKGIDKNWRSPMFDRVLTRFYHKWLVSREWSVRKFWEEFEEEEYRIDPLKYDWIRWSKTGHQGFSLTKEEIQQGISAEAFMKGLSRSDEGVWSWDPSAPIRNRGPQTDASSAGPLVPSTAETEVITDITRSKPNVEIKRENIDSLESGDDTLSTQTAVPLSPSSHPAGKLHPLPTPSRALPSSKRLREDPESDTLHAEKRKRVVTATVSADPLPAPDTVTSQLDATGELEHPLWQNDEDMHVSNANANMDPEAVPLALPFSSPLHALPLTSTVNTSFIAVPTSTIQQTPLGRSSPSAASHTSPVSQEIVSESTTLDPRRLATGPSDSSLTCVTTSDQSDVRALSEGLNDPITREGAFVKSPSTSSFSIASSAPSPSPYSLENTAIIRPPADLTAKVSQRSKALDETISQRTSLAFRDNLLTPPPETSAQATAGGLSESWGHPDEGVDDVDEADKESSDDMELDSENEEISFLPVLTPIPPPALPTSFSGSVQASAPEEAAIESSHPLPRRYSLNDQPKEPPSTSVDTTSIHFSTPSYREDQESRPNGRTKPLSPAIAILKAQALEIDPPLSPLADVSRDLTAQQSPTTPCEQQMSPNTSSIAYQFRNKSVGKAVSALMRNVADLLEVAGDNSTVDEEGGICLQGKGKARDVPHRLSSPSFLDEGIPRTPTSSAHSPVISLLVEELRAMRSQMQRLERDQAEGLETLRLLYRSEIASLREELKAKNDGRRAELERLLEEHEQRFVARIAKQEEDLLSARKKALASERQAVSLVLDDVHDLRRKVASLELRYPYDGIQTPHSATAGFSPPTREATPPLATASTGKTTIRQPVVHSLGVRPTASPAVQDSIPSQKRVERRPSTSTTRGEPTVGAPPLPIKSQRKHYSASFGGSNSG